MSNPDMWEKRLQSWSPRRPSERIGRTLFEARAGVDNSRASRTGDVAAGEDARTPNRFRRLEIWNWVTPVAACCLTVIVLCSSTTRRMSQYDSRENATYFATLMFDAAPSNAASQTFALSKGDENIEWNVWAHATVHSTNFEMASASSYTNGARGTGAAGSQMRAATNGIYP